MEEKVAFKELNWEACFVIRIQDKGFRFVLLDKKY